MGGKKRNWRKEKAAFLANRPPKYDEDGNQVFPVHRTSCFMFGCGSVWPKRKPSQPDTVLFKAPESADRSLWTANIPTRFYPFDFDRHHLCYKHFETKYLVQSAEDGTPLDVLNWTLIPDALPTIFDTTMIDKSLNKKRRRKQADEARNMRKKCRIEGKPVPEWAVARDQKGNPLPGSSGVSHPQDPQGCDEDYSYESDTE